MKKIVGYELQYLVYQDMWQTWNYAKTVKSAQRMIANFKSIKPHIKWRVLKVTQELFLSGEGKQ